MKIDDICNDKKLVHASNIQAKLTKKKLGQLTPKQNIAISDIEAHYLVYINKQLTLRGISDKILSQRVDLLNEYYDFLDHNYSNTFSSQGKFRSSILEEFLYLVFKDEIAKLKKDIKDDKNTLLLGNAKAYTNIYFSPANIKCFINDLSIGVNTKDQDFAIFREAQVVVDGKSYIVNIPIVAIEAKTYLDKTMLEGSIATAEKIKMGNPYTKFYVATESYDVSFDVDPSYSRIDQIFVLRKSKRKDREHHNIYFDVVKSMVDEIRKHLNDDWGDTEAKLNKQGIIIHK